MRSTFTISGANGLPIHGDITDSDLSIEATVIFIHGFKGFKDWGAHHLSAAYFASHGFRFVKFNLSHSGVNMEQQDDITDPETFGKNTFSIELYDINQVIEHIGRQFPDQPIYLIGHSRGGGLAIITATENERVKKLATWASVSDFTSLWPVGSEKEWLKNGRIFNTNKRTGQQLPLNRTLLEDITENKERLSVTDAADKISVPWLIVHGTNDPGVAFASAGHLAGRQPNTKLLPVEGADHVFGATHPYLLLELPADLKFVCKQTIDFFKQNT